MPEGESLLSHGSKEEGETKKPERSVWIIDDNSEHINSLFRVLRFELGKSMHFLHFKEGEEAILRFTELLEEGQDLPSLIFMDYKLDDNVKDPKYQKGVDVIKELQVIASEHEVTLPDIVAFSSEQSFTDELLAAGARDSVKKTELLSVIAYIKRVAEGSEE